MTVLVVLVACSVSDPASVEPAEVDIQVNPSVTEQDLLKQGAPSENGADQAMMAIATAHGVGLARCPAQASGRFQRLHGTIRDHVLRVGPRLMVEVNDDVPWSPLYDEVVAYDNWVSLLVEPGDTTAYVRLHDRTLAYQFPAATTGQTVVCTEVTEVQPRVVTGKVNASKAAMFAVGCGEKGTRIAKDGTFVVDAAAPCPLWVETEDALRSNPITVAPGNEKLELGQLELVADTLQNADQTWTDAGRTALAQVIAQSASDSALQSKTFTEIEAALEGNAQATQRLTHWRRRFSEWDKQAALIQEGLDGNIPL